MGRSPVAGLKWQATHVQPGFGVRSELGKHARINCAADSRHAGAARSGITTLPLREAHDPDRPTAVLRPTLRAETTLTWRCELRAAASTWLRRARAFACLACASRGWPGSIPKASSDLRSGQGVWVPTAVLGLRRGARGGELRRGSSAYRCAGCHWQFCFCALRNGNKHTETLPEGTETNTQKRQFCLRSICR